MRTALSRALLAAALAAVAAPACGYGPDFESGTLACGPAASCPDGYHCAGDGTCWRDDDGPSTCGTTTAEQLLGHWVFVSPSRRKIICTDGGSEDIAWTGDFFDIEAGGSAALRTYYYCDMDLDIGATGATVLRPGASCSAPNPNDPTITFTWTPATFTLSTTNGCTGTLAASIPYTATDGTLSVACTMDFTGTLTKT